MSDLPIQTTPDGKSRYIVAPGAITLEYKGRTWVAIDPEVFYWEDEGWAPHEWYWLEGNMSCQCNLIRYTDLTPESAPELFHHKGEKFSDGSEIDETHERCGDNIKIKSVIPDDKRLHPLIVEPWEEPTAPTPPDHTST